MKFNMDKFEYVKYGRNEDLKHLSQYTYQDNKPIEKKDSVEDLGVLMSSNGSFSNHIDNIY